MESKTEKKNECEVKEKQERGECWKLFWLKYKRGGELDFKTF